MGPQNASLGAPLIAARRDDAAAIGTLYERLLGTRVSRREVIAMSLGLAGAAAFWAPLARAAAGFRVQRRKAAVTISLGAEVLFRISPDLFDSDPRIECKSSADAVCIMVTGGRLPGSNVAADLTLAAERNGLSWDGRFALPALGFFCEFPFEQWLLGQPVARGKLALTPLFAHAKNLVLNQNAPLTAAFYPSWTFGIESRRGVSLATEAGEVSAGTAQLEFVPPSTADIGITTRKLPRTRLWISGSLAGTAPVQVEGASALLRPGEVDLVAEMQRGRARHATTGYAVETRAAGVVAQVAPGNAAPPEVTSFDATKARVTAVGAAGADCKRLDADLDNGRIWRPCNDCNVEITALDGSFKSERDAGAKANFRVTRVMVPMSGLDQAVFVRRIPKKKADGTPGQLSDVLYVPEIDGRAWMDKRSSSAAELPLDQFDLHLSRGVDALQLEVRFRNVSLATDESPLALVRAPKASESKVVATSLLEFSLGRQHVFEQALYITDLLGKDAVKTQPVITDEQICEVLGLGEGDACRNKMCCARVEGRYTDLYDQARKLLKAPDPEDLKKARARFSGNSWLTFDWKESASSDRTIALTLEDLLDFDRKDRRGIKRFRQLRSTYAILPHNKDLNGPFDPKLDKLRPASLEDEGVDDREYVSSIEAPYRLALSALDDIKWKSPGRGVTQKSGRKEIWSLRAEKLPMRAVWSPDYLTNDFWAKTLTHGGGPFRSSLDPRDRHEIVALSGRFGQPALLGSANVVVNPLTNDEKKGIYVPQPMQVRMALLSSYGATLRLRGKWTPPASADIGALTVELWDQASQLGRDNKVVVEYKGFLFPLGHPATLVKETERRLVDLGAEGIVARLVQRFFIRVPALARSVPLLQQPFEGRGWPFGNISMRAFVTGDLAHPLESQVPDLGLGQQAFWPKLAPVRPENPDRLDVDFEFEDTATGVKASAPCLFVDNAISHTPPLLLQVIRYYREHLELARNGGTNNLSDPRTYKSQLLDESPIPRPFVARVVSGKVRFAPADKPGNTSHRVTRFLLDVDVPRPPAPGSAPIALCPDPCATPKINDPSKFPLEEADAHPTGAADVETALRATVALEKQNQPPFYPHLRQALVEPGTLSRLANTGRQAALVEIDSGFLRKGFDQDNAGEVYLRYVNAGAALAFDSDTGNSGGFANTTTNMSAVTRKKGPIGGVGEPMPQPPGYRYGLNGGSPMMALVRVSAQDAADPVAMARKGAADPKEFFGRSLGNAKLCGVVRFSDIIDVVLKASGSKAPQILEQIENSLPLDEAKKAIGTFKTKLAAEFAKQQEQVPPRIRAAILEIIELLDRASQAANTQLPSIIVALVSAAQNLRDEVRTAIDNPATLLPPEAAQWVNDLQVLRQTFTKGEIKKLAEAAATQIIVDVRREMLEGLEKELAKDPRYRQLLERVTDVRLSFGRIEAAAGKDPLDFLRVLSTEILALTDGAVDLSVWNTWVDSAYSKLNDQLQAYWGAFALWLAGQARNIREAATKLQIAIDVAKEEIEKKIEQMPLDRARLERAFFHVSELSLATAGHAAEIANAIEKISQIGSIDLRNRENLAVLKRAGATLRASLDSVAKAERLLVIAQEMNGLLVQTKLDAVIGYYKKWLELVARDCLNYLFEKIENKAIEAIAEIADENLKAALGWLCEKAADAKSKAQQIGLNYSIDAQGNITVTVPLPADLVVVYEVIGFIEGAPDPEKIAKQALQRAQVKAHRVAVDRLLETANWLARWLKPVADKVSAAVLACRSENVQKWVSPSLIDRLTSIDALTQRAGTQLVQGAGLPVVRDYFENKLPAPAREIKRLIEEIGDAVSNGDVSALVNVRALLDEALQELGVPTKAVITYDWDTQVRPYPSGSSPVFEPIAGTGKLTISSRTVIDLTGETKPQMEIKADLDAFKINLFGSAAFLTIYFKPLKFIGGTGRKSKLTADVSLVEFGGELAFVKKLQDYLKDKFGITVVPWTEGPGIVVGYEFFYDIISVGPFSIQNVGFGISCILPFNSEPARFRFTLSSPERPFLLSVGIYGGGGFVGIQSRADTIEFLEMSYEYGLVTGFKFGVATGTGRITAGIYFRVGKRVALLSGFFNASGNCDVAGLITVSANFRVQVWYDTKSGKAAGSATFSISFSIGIADFTYKVGVAYACQGGKKEDAGSQKQKSNNPAIAPSFMELGGLSRQGLIVSDKTDDTDPVVNDLHAREQKADIAAKIAADKDLADLSRELLSEKNWQRYWAAFEEPFDECA